MAKENIPTLEDIALQRKLNDIGGVVRKYVNSTGLQSNIPPTEKPYMFVQALGGSLEAGYSDIRKDVKEDKIKEGKIQEFVDLIYKNRDQSAAVAPEADQKVINLQTAMIEANLKGFSYKPEQINLNLQTLSDNEKKVIKNAINETFLEQGATDHKLTSSKYVLDTTEKINKKLADSIPPLSENVLKECKEFLEKCNKSEETEEINFSPAQKTKIDKELENTLQGLSGYINDNIDINKKLGKAISLIQEARVEGQAKDVLLKTFEQLESEKIDKYGKEIINNFGPLLNDKDKPIAKSTESALAKLDSGYLSEYSAVIAAELKTVNEKGTSWWEKFKSVFTHTDYLAEKLEKVTDNYVLKNNEYVEKEINNKIFLNTVKDTEIATGLTKFIEENRTKIVNSKSSNLEPLIPDAFNRVVITAKKDKLPEGIRENDIVHELKKVNLAELRKVNPVGFDKALFGQAPSYDKIPPPQPLPEVTREVAQTQKPVTPTKTPISKAQEVLDNRGNSQRKERGIGL